MILRGRTIWHLIWRASETTGIGLGRLGRLGRLGPFVFGRMIGRKGRYIG